MPETPYPAEHLTVEKIGFNFRIYWTKMTLRWSAARRQTVRQQVLALTQADEFDPNLIEKRYELPLEAIPERTHSGASLLALLEVLTALDAMDQD